MVNILPRPPQDAFAELAALPDGQRGWSVAVIEDPASLRPLIPELTALADEAIEPNVFYEPWMLLPALEQLAPPGRSIACALVYRNRRYRHLPPLLCGLFPLELRRPRLSATTVRLWRHRHCFLCAPLLRREAAAPALAAFLDWVAAPARGVDLLELDTAPLEGPFHQLLVEELNARGWINSIRRSYTRAFLRARGDGEGYLRAALAGRRRKEYRRQLRRLADRGPVRFFVLDAADDADAWIDAFLQLEQSGWKGREGTALAARRADERFFRQVVREAHAARRVVLSGLRVGDEAVALKCTFLGGEGAFAFKIAFDESHARFSPGVQLELDEIRRACADPALEWIDSCAAQEHPMINRLWAERRTVGTSLIALGGRAELLLSLLPLARWVRRWWGKRRRPDER